MLWAQAVTYPVKTLEGWQYKLLISPAILVYEQLFHGNGIIILAFYALFFLDLLTGVISAIKRQCFCFVRKDAWLIKLLVYTLSIGVLGIVNEAIVQLSGFSIPVLDGCITLMIASEALSILNNLQECTNKVPHVLVEIIAKIQKKTAKQLNDSLQIEDNNDFSSAD